MLYEEIDLGTDPTLPGRPPALSEAVTIRRAFGADRRPVFRTTAQGPPVVFGEYQGQLCFVGDASPYRMFIYEAPDWVEFVNIGESTAAEKEEILQDLDLVDDEGFLLWERCPGSAWTASTPDLVHGMGTYSLDAVSGKVVYEHDTVNYPNFIETLPIWFEATIGSSAYIYASFTNICLSPGFTTIGNSAFYDNSSLTTVSLPDSLTSIGDYAFAGCTAISSFTAPGLVTAEDYAFHYSFASGATVSLPKLTSIGSFGFYYTSAESFSLPLLEAIPVSCFRHNTEIASLTAPSVLSIGAYAFAFCPGLTALSFPLVTSIGDFAFSDCSTLASISLPVATLIGSNAFYGCASLTSILLPSVTSIADGAFSNCTAIEAIYVNLPLSKVGANAFSTGSDGILYVHSQYLSTYEQEVGDLLVQEWKTYPYPAT